MAGEVTEAGRYEYKTRYAEGRGADYESLDETVAGIGWRRVWADITMQGAFIVYRRERMLTPEEKLARRPWTADHGGDG